MDILHICIGMNDAFGRLFSLKGTDEEIGAGLKQVLFVKGRIVLKLAVVGDPFKADGFPEAEWEW